MAKMLKRGMLREEAAGVTNMTEIKLMLNGIKELKRPLAIQVDLSL